MSEPSLPEKERPRPEACHLPTRKVSWAFIYNVVRTLARAPRWTVISTGLVSVMVWLLVTVLAGLLLAGSKIWAISPFDPIAALHAHAHAGIFGVFILLIVAVSFKLLLERFRRMNPAFPGAVI